MLTQSSPTPEGTHIAGLVDGTLTLQRDADGGLSLQLTFGSAQRVNGPLLEIGLSDDAVRDLTALLDTGDRTSLHLQCHVGVRAREI